MKPGALMAYLDRFLRCGKPKPKPKSHDEARHKAVKSGYKTKRG